MEPIKIAFYGKGGIVKSTISANVSALLAKRGKRVLHIGCDPKADSTRSLTDKKIPTVLNQINALGENLTRDDIVFRGACGVSCIEAGGPQAGVGCAGMGIMAMEEELKRLKILEEGWDVIIYDVLGDVVCGGFSVPMRKHYVQKVYVVTSSDCMALYAANNILKGVRRYSSQEHGIMGGIILNHCLSDIDKKTAEAYAATVKTDILHIVPESREVKLADYKKEPVSILYPDSEAAQGFEELAEKILHSDTGTVPCPMDDDEMEAFCQNIFELKGSVL